MKYNRDKLRFDRSKLLLGTYCLQPYARTEAHIKDLAEAKIDFICAAPYDRQLLDYCEKYGIGVFVNYLPGWWGGDGDNAGKLAEKVPVSAYEKAAAEFQDHPAIWALDTGDEPSALDFPHYGKLFEAAYRLFEEQMPYLNLYPNYASVAQNNAEQKVNQLGTNTYQEHIDQFAEYVDCDYICYDYYMYSAGVSGGYENLRIVADKCRATGRDLWIVLQVNSSKPEIWISENELRHQAYTAMAFGAKSINWACWTAGWWNNQVLDQNGEKTEQYPKLRTVNGELKALGEIYMKYSNISTSFLGFEGMAGMERVKQQPQSSADAGVFHSVTPESGALIMGHMKGEKGEALMLADASDPYDNAPVSYKISFRCAGKVTAYDCGKEIAIKSDGDVYSISMSSCRGVLVTAE